MYGSGSWILNGIVTFIASVMGITQHAAAKLIPYLPLFSLDEMTPYGHPYHQQTANYFSFLISPTEYELQQCNSTAKHANSFGSIC